MVASTLGGIEFELQKALRSGEAATSSATFAAFLDTLQGGEDVNGDVELAFRRALDNCMEEDGVLAAECAAIMEDSSVMRLIQFSLTLCEQNPSHQCTTLPKVLSPPPTYLSTYYLSNRSFIRLSNAARNTALQVPFILLEDLLEALSVRSAEALWSFVESLAERSTAEPFSKGKLVILRTCNSMLRKLSKVVHSRFSGRILMFMAALCPISDRSAVNLTGKFNTGKSIIFDDEVCWTPYMCIAIIIFVITIVNSPSIGDFQTRFRRPVRDNPPQPAPFPQERRWRQEAARRGRARDAGAQQL